MKSKFFFSVWVFALAFANANSQTQVSDSTYRKFFVGSSLMVLGNLIPDDPNPPDFIQLNFGYRITAKNVVSTELITWKYAWPLGIPYGDAKEAQEEKYPGYVRTFGIALVYQHFFWEGAYASVHALNGLQKYMTTDDEHIQNGYQLFMTYRLGYHFKLFKNKLFIEPSVAMTHWLVNTNVPDSFTKLEDKWSNYFLPEPGLHFGYKF